MSRKNNRKNNNSFSIKGNISAGRDVIMGDQVNIKQSINVNTPTDFVNELKKIHTELTSLKKDTAINLEDKKLLDSAETNLESAISEAQKRKPASETIKNALDNAKEIMEKISSNASTAIALSTILAKLSQVTLKLFGG